MRSWPGTTRTPKRRHCAAHAAGTCAMGIAVLTEAQALPAGYTASCAVTAAGASIVVWPFCRSMEPCATPAVPHPLASTAAATATATQLRITSLPEDRIPPAAFTRADGASLYTHLFAAMQVR